MKRDTKQTKNNEINEKILDFRLFRYFSFVSCLSSSASNDPASYFDWWPTRGTTEWIEYAFANPAEVSGVEIYWFDDTGRGQVRVPQSWRILYRDGEEWKPVENPGPYGVEKDRYNKVNFKPVKSSGLRLEITMQPSWSAGLQEWKVK